MDEAQEVNDASFREQCQPFVTKTRGCSYVLGTTLPDDSNLLYSYYKDRSIPDELKIIYNWEEVCELKTLISKEEGDGYKLSIEKEIANFGKDSDYILTQYYCSFKIRGTRFITMEDLERNNILSGGNINSDLKTIQIKKELEQNYVFRIGAYDPALTQDYAGIATGIATKMGNINQFSVIMKDCKILNKNDRNMSTSELLDKVVDICDYNNLDMIMIDATAAQIDRAYMLVAKLKARGVDTLVIPFNYAGNNKQLMMKYFEDSISNQTLKLPNNLCRSSHEDYDELLKELLYFQRIPKSNGNVEYRAPEGGNFHDDLVFALAMLNYCCKYTLDCQSRKKEVMLGSGIKYRLRLYKNRNNVDTLLTDSKQEDKNRRISYLFL